MRLLVRATWQGGPRAERPALVIVHGLGGSDASAYVLSTGRLAYARGWHVVRVNMRGAGDGEALCARLYNAGLDADVLAVVAAVAAVTPRVVVAGFSLGGQPSVARRSAGAASISLRRCSGSRPCVRRWTSRPAPTRSPARTTGSTSTIS